MTTPHDSMLSSTLTDPLHGCDELAQTRREEQRTARQQAQRELERVARQRAVRAAAAAATCGMSQAAAARCLHLAPRTLNDWCHQTHFRCQLRGRTCKQSAPLQRRAALEVLETEGPQLGLETLRTLVPDLPRCELADLLRSFRALYLRDHRWHLEELTWNVTGSVWAIDHAEPPRSIEGTYPAILAVRDLASGMQLAWLPVRDETSRSTAEVLERLFFAHGAPLVVKSDNGSAFRGQDVQQLLTAHEILWLPSPPYLPRYNGSCEAGIGSLQERTLCRAARAGRACDWTTDDLCAARDQANQFGRPLGPQHPAPKEAWQARDTLPTALRAQLHQLAHQHFTNLLATYLENPDILTLAIQHELHRQAMRRALLQLELLSTSRRSIPLPFKRLKSAKIS